MVESVVVVGAGLAAHKVVENLRKEGFEGRIALVGDEQHRPYDRPGLSKAVLLGDAEPNDLYLARASFYDDKGIETHFGDAAVAIDRDARTVTLASGAELPYDALVLATGSEARRLTLPGSDLDGVLTLRKFEDTLTLADALRPGTRLVIVGGGWIGLEAASAAIEAEASVTVLEHFELPLLTVLGDEIAPWFAKLHRDHGVDLRTGVDVEAFEGDGGTVTGVRLGDGEVIPADVVLVGVGAIPNTDLAAAAGLPVDNGVRVDEHLRTEDPHVLAVGDIAHANNTALGRPLRVEHWDNARRQGRLAALVLLGRDDVYDWQPYFYTDQYDVSMEYIGHGTKDDDIVVRGSLDDDHFSAYWLDGDTITAAMQVNEPRLAGPLRQVVGLTVDRGRLADPGVPLDAFIGA
ncbi:MAG TPA: FAD-dependent oxidoreductase [Propionibacterium sp.]|nr:FAD-dependent oxidoreductase [Propionibacterium sp.]